MKKLELLGAKLLTKEEMNDVKGGYNFYCQCNNGSAAWLGNYSSGDYAKGRAAYWCEDGGRCIQLA